MTTFVYFDPAKLRVELRPETLSLAWVYDQDGVKYGMREECGAPHADFYNGPAIIPEKLAPLVTRVTMRQTVTDPQHQGVIEPGDHIAPLAKAHVVMEVYPNNAPSHKIVIDVDATTIQAAEALMDAVLRGQKPTHSYIEPKPAAIYATAPFWKRWLARLVS